MSIARLFSTWIERLQTGASVTHAFGEPIEAQGRTLIPVARVYYGFGGGGGGSDAAEGELDEASDQEAVVKGDPSCQGSGGGGGAMARPLGVLEVSQAGTRFIATRDNSKLYAGIATGVVLGLWLARRKRK